MPFLRRVKNCCAAIEARRVVVEAPLTSAAGVGRMARILAVAVTAAALAACAQSTALNKHSEWFGTGRQASLASPSASSATNRHTATTTKNQTEPAAELNPFGPTIASYGLASFYADDTETASGQKFDPRDFTAAHPTLPFGTRLRVTDVDTGRSVIVRVNDRGPYVPGRIVDVSYSAATTLGMTDRGIAKVKVEVVR